MTKERLSGWGRLFGPGKEMLSENLERLTRGAVLSRGLGRSYGDSSLPPADHPEVVGTRLADRLLAFDEATGVLRAEAGLSLRTLNRLLLPRGFYSPVTPGTQIITLGGMVAADVHGKNHHVAGTFGRHVRSIKLRVGNGRVLTCSPALEPELFWATLGGMGLTGHMLEVEFALERVPSAWIWSESRRIDDVDAFLEALKAARGAWPHTMGWIDCLSRGSKLGRGILFQGRWAQPEEAPAAEPAAPRRPSLPFLLPSWAINRWSVRTFNNVHYHWHGPQTRRHLVHPETFFYPLDAIGDWNRLYGRAGFTQYQCVLPEQAGLGSARRFLDLLTRRGGASMLCVIKDCGEQGNGLLSFPMPGITIALDIPVRGNTQALVDALNELVIAEGGRVYLAKDQFTRPEHFRAMEPRLERWLAIRRRWDPEGLIRSAQSVRLLGDKP